LEINKLLQGQKGYQLPINNTIPFSGILTCIHVASRHFDLQLFLIHIYTHHNLQLSIE